MAYKVILSTEVSQAIDSIHDYITTLLLSPQSAKNTVAKILDSLKSLEIFPEAGFDADEKIGVKINSKYPIRRKLSVNISCFTLSIRLKKLFFFPTYSTQKVTMLPCYKAKITKTQNHHFNVHCSLNSLVIIKNTVCILTRKSKNFALSIATQWFPEYKVFQLDQI